MVSNTGRLAALDIRPAAVYGAGWQAGRRGCKAAGLWARWQAGQAGAGSWMDRSAAGGGSEQQPTGKERVVGHA